MKIKGRRKKISTTLPQIGSFGERKTTREEGHARGMMAGGEERDLEGEGEESHEREWKVGDWHDNECWEAKCVCLYDYGIMTKLPLTPKEGKARSKGKTRNVTL